MWHQMDVLLGWKRKTVSLSAFNRWFMDADFGWHLIRLGGSSHALGPHSCISVSPVKYLMDCYFSMCIYLTNTTLNCLLLIDIIFVFSQGWFTTFKPLSGCVFFFFFFGPQIVMSLYAVECVWRVGRSTLPLPLSLLHAVWSALPLPRPVPPLRPPPLFSPRTRPPFMPSAPWTSALSTPHPPSFPQCLFCLLNPDPSLSLHPPSSIFTWCPCCRCPIVNKVFWEP